MQEAKLLGHIVSPKGVRIDPSRVQEMKRINIPRNKNEVQSFLGKINILRRFIPNFAQIFKQITNILRKDNEISWSNEGKRYFERIKEKLIEALVLISPNYS